MLNSVETHMWSLVQGLSKLAGAAESEFLPTVRSSKYVDVTRYTARIDDRIYTTQLDGATW